MNIKYIVPSYNRADGVTTLDYLSKAEMWVSPEDYPDYIKHNPHWADRIHAMPEGYQGFGKARAMNWVLDNLYTDDLDGLMIIDDDITTLKMHVIEGDRKHKDVPEERLYELVENYTRMAYDWGCGMWSFGLNSDPMSYCLYAPFRLHGYLDGGLQGFCRKDTIRYDERLTVKEDVDMFLQQLEKYNKAMRVDKYYWQKRSFEGKGGSQAFRVDNAEKEQFKMMQQKWGSKIIRPNKPTSRKKSGIRSQGGAIKLRIPLNGV